MGFLVRASKEEKRYSQHIGFRFFFLIGVWQLISSQVISQCHTTRTHKIEAAIPDDEKADKAGDDVGKSGLDGLEFTEEDEIMLFEESATVPPSLPAGRPCCCVCV